MTNWTSVVTEMDGGKDACPVFKDRDPDCFYLNLNSFNIPKAIQFCLQDFRRCPIYQKHVSPQWATEMDGHKGTCPVFKDRDPDCYYLNLNSVIIPKAIRFCLQDFRQCPIYQKHVPPRQA